MPSLTALRPADGERRSRSPKLGVAQRQLRNARFAVQYRLGILALVIIAALIAPPAQPAHAAWTLDCDTAANIAVSADQCRSLQSLYENLGGDDWTDNTNWGTDTDVDGWYGVYRSGGDVTVIDLFNNNLSGDIDAVNLSALTGLGVIDLSDNQIRGDIDGWDISALTALEYLDLYTNQIGGQIDGWDISALTNLWNLDLSDNQIGGEIDGWDISALTALEVLDLYTNQIGGQIDGWDISALTNLWNLDLYNNQIGGQIDAWDISALTALEYLDLDSNQIGGEIEGWDISALTALEVLVLAENRIGGEIDGWDISALTALEYLDLYNNQIGGQIDAWDISALTGLQVLDLYINQIGGTLPDWDISTLTSLWVLDLGSNRIQGDPSRLTYPATLTYLYFDDNGLSGTVPDLTGTDVAAGELWMCPNAELLASGVEAVDAFAQANDATGWTVRYGCGDGNDDGRGGGKHGDDEPDSAPEPAPSPIPVVFGTPSVTVTADPSGASPGGQVTWTVIVANEGENPTDNVLYMRSELPPALAMVSAESTRREVLVDGQSVETAIGVLQPGESVVVTLVTAVREDAMPGEVCLTASADWNYAVSGTGCVQILPTTLPDLGGQAALAEQSGLRYAIFAIAAFLVVGLVVLLLVNEREGMAAAGE